MSGVLLGDEWGSYCHQYCLVSSSVTYTDVIECNLSKFAGYTRLSGAVNMPEGQDSI